MAFRNQLYYNIHFMKITSFYKYLIILIFVAAILYIGLFELSQSQDAESIVKLSPVSEKININGSSNDLHTIEITSSNLKQTIISNHIANTQKNSKKFSRFVAERFKQTNLSIEDSLLLVDELRNRYNVKFSDEWITGVAAYNVKEFETLIRSELLSNSEARYGFQGVAAKDANYAFDYIFPHLPDAIRSLAIDDMLFTYLEQDSMSASSFVLSLQEGSISFVNAKKIVHSWLQARELHEEAKLWK